MTNATVRERPESPFRKALSLAFLAGALGATAAVCPFNDLDPQDNTVVNDFWDCRAHVCSVERVVSSSSSIGVGAATVSVPSSVPFVLEARSFVWDWSLFDFTTFPPAFFIFLQ